MKSTQKSFAVCLISAAVLVSFGVSAETQTQQTSPSRSFATELATASQAKGGDSVKTEADIQKMRDDGMGWGQIANSLGLSLGAVVSAANRADQATENAANKRPCPPAVPDLTSGPGPRSAERSYGRGRGNRPLGSFRLPGV